MKQFTKGLFISFYLKAIGATFVLFSIEVTSIYVIELYGFSKKKQKIAPFRKSFAKK